MNTNYNRERDTFQQIRAGDPTRRFVAGQTPRAPRPPAGSTQRRAASPSYSGYRVSDGRQPVGAQRRDSGDHGAPPIFMPPDGRRTPTNQTSQPQPARVSPPARQYAAAANAGHEKRLSIIERLMLRGVRGELVQQPWFQNIRQQNADVFVFVSYGATVLLTLIVDFLVGTVSTAGALLLVVVVYPLWIVLAYLYMAVGTKTAHQFLQWGICAGGAVLALIPVWEALRAMDADHRLEQLIGVDVIPMGLLIFELFFNLAMTVLFAYLGVLVYRSIARLAK